MELKTDALMDLCTCGDTRGFRRRLVAASPVMVGTVPVYDAVARYGKDVAERSRLTISSTWSASMPRTGSTS